jgi:hypothetical protein
MVSYPEDYRGEEKEEQAIVRIRIPLDRSQLQERTLPHIPPFPSLPSHSYFHITHICVVSESKLEDQDEKAGGAPSKSVSMIRESVLKDQSQVTFPEIEIEDKVYIEIILCLYE